MDAAPKLSFIVLSYNYADLIGQTIRSILEQTVSDLEVVVVDDASRDDSCAVVQSFGDPRIRLLMNERTLGGAGSYNRAVTAARGEWLVNLDADDWIAPDKSAKQLAYLRDHPAAVLGTYTNYVDRQGRPHPNQAALNDFVNRPFDLNAIDTWIGLNRLVRSSTMVSRAVHLSVGLDDPGMVRAPDFELWTRFLRHGHRIDVLAEKLTFYRLHGNGVTYGDPTGSLLEMSYAMLRNLVPAIEARAAWPSLRRIISWWLAHEAFARLRPVERYRLVGMLLLPFAFSDFAEFRAGVQAEAADPALAVAGQRLLALSQIESWTAPPATVQMHWMVARIGRALLGRERASRVRHTVHRLVCGG